MPHRQRIGMLPRVQGEAFDFGTPVVIDGAVEVWMSAVEKEMRTTLHRLAASHSTLLLVDLPRCVLLACHPLCL